MAPVQTSPDMLASEHNTAVMKTSSYCHQGLTPPDSPTKGLASPPATVKDLKHLFGVLEKVLPDLQPRTSKHSCLSESFPTRPDMVQLKQLLVKLIEDGYTSVGPFVATKPALSYFASNELEKDVQATNVIDLKRPIYTTPSDFISFEKWASAPNSK